MANTRHFGTADPFAAFDVGEYGAELGVHRDDIAPELSHETLQLVRVRVAEDGTLRRADDDAVVRAIVHEAQSEDALLDGMLADLPPEADEDDLLLSTLIHEAIPPAFVRLDRPDGENVVTKVMALDADVDRHGLLLSLGRAAQSEGITEEIVDKYERALDTLLGFDDPAEVERVVEERLL